MKDLGKGKNKRLYIGPGKEDNTDDKIAVDRKVGRKNTKVEFNRAWHQHGYKKTSFGLFTVTDNDGKTRDVWTLIECQVGLDTILDLEKLEVDGTLGHIKEAVIILHPHCSDPMKIVEDGETAIAYLAINPEFDFEEDVCCFYCGEDYADEHPPAKDHTMQGV